MPHIETTLESKEIFNGHVIRVTLDTVRLENGDTAYREIVHHHGGACILPVDDEGNVYMVRQFRYALGEEIWELPAGKLEAGEDPFEAAKRELSEECGLTADHFTDLGVLYATLFTNDLWLLNPETDLLLRLVPEQFFADFAGVIAARALAYMAAVPLAIFGVRFGRRFV